MKRFFLSVFLCTSFALCLLLSACDSASSQLYTSATFAMDVLVDQQAYGTAAQDAMQAVNVALAEYDTRLSLHSPTSEIAAINAAAGKGGAEVSPDTAQLLSHALNLSAQTDGAFALTVAPLTLAWGITGESPRVVPQGELNTLLPLVNDAAVEITQNRVTLPTEGMGIDLGGVAKGAACDVAQEIYTQHGVQSAVLNIGGNVYAHGTHPDGTPFRIGFADPSADSNSAYIASFALSDAVVSISGGYERYADIEGERYIHIIDPLTGLPATSDVLSVGVISTGGAMADMYSTTLFIQGVQGALEYMRGGGVAILLDHEQNLYVSQSLQDSFELSESSAASYTLTYIPQEDTP